MEYVRGVMRSVGLGIEGVGRFTFLAHDVAKVSSPFLVFAASPFFAESCFELT